MARSEAHKRANNKWDTTHMTVLGCKVRKEKADAFKAACKDAGTTPNAVFTSAMDEFLRAHECPQEAAGSPTGAQTEQGE